MNITTTLILALLICLSITMNQKQLQDVVDTHFKSYDANNDKLLNRQQYIQGLKKQQKAEGLDEQDHQYYIELTDWLYEYYDNDKDSAISLQQWRIFSKDIMDQDSPQYKEISKDPRMIEPEL